MNYGLRYEPFIPFDQKGGRHTTWVPGVQSTVVPDAPTGILFPGDPGLPARLTNSDLNNFAPRLGVAWDVTGDAKTVVRGGYGIFYQQINGETTHAAEGPWRGTTQLRQGRIEDPFGSLGQTEPPPESPGRFGCSPISEYPGLRCTQYPVPIRIVYTDQDLRTSYTHHFSASLQRQLDAESRRSRRAYIGKIGNDLVGHNYFNAAPFINSPITGQPPTLQNVEQRVPFSPGIISAQSRVLGNFFRSEYHSLQLRVERRMARTLLVLGVLCAVEEPDEPAGEHDRADQQHSESVRPRFAVGAVVPRSPSRRRRVLGVEPAARRSAIRFVGALLNGWTLTGFHRIQSGSPLVFTMGTDVAQNGILQPNGQYALLVPGMTADDVRRDHSSTAGHDRGVLQHRGVRAAEQRAARHLRRRRARAHLRSRRRDHGPRDHALRQPRVRRARCSCAASSSTRSTR